jgi:hypothetical protein
MHTGTRADGAGAAATTQTSMTAVRAMRVVARITVGIRLLRALVKAAKIAKRCPSYMCICVCMCICITVGVCALPGISGL